MSVPIEDRLSDLEARCLAYETVIYDLVHSMWPIEQHREERRESACRAVEAAMPAASTEHWRLQAHAMLAKVEDLYGSHRPRSDESQP